MSIHHYRFVTRWQMDAAPAEVFRILENVVDFPRWWPSVWLRVEEVRPKDDRGIGQLVRVTTKGLLPYILDWTSESVVNEFPRRLELRASGDFVGRGEWQFLGDGPGTRITYVWEITADKPLLRVLSPIFKPVFSANHHWAMKRGEESLRLEIARLHATSDEERARIPSPPAPMLTGAQRRRWAAAPVRND